MPITHFLYPFYKTRRLLNRTQREASEARGDLLATVTLRTRSSDPLPHTNSTTSTDSVHSRRDTAPHLERTVHWSET